jgi:uncharacterized Zn-binding protein involved in type VI secretion
MFGLFSQYEFGLPWFVRRRVGKAIAVIGDISSHGGVIMTSNQDGRFKVGGIAVAVAGAMHLCPITGHGTTAITAVTIKTYCNGKLIITKGAVAGCGAKINPPNRKVFVE